MLAQPLVSTLTDVAQRRLGGNLRLLGVYGTGADAKEVTSDLDFVLIVDYVESCVTHATRDCRDIYPSVQFFVISSAEYAYLSRYYRFQFAFARKLAGDFDLPLPTRDDAIESIEHGFIDTLRTVRQQLKRREWTIGDDWARQTWWNLKSFKYALLDTCWLIRGNRPRDVETASLILLSEGYDKAAAAIVDWPQSVDIAAQQLTHDPISWVLKWESRINAAYAEIRPQLKK